MFAELTCCAGLPPASPPVQDEEELLHLPTLPDSAPAEPPMSDDKLLSTLMQARLRPAWAHLCTVALPLILCIP